jgi:hypothetical protein
VAALRRQRGDGLTFQLSRSAQGRTRVAQVSFGRDRERPGAGVLGEAGGDVRGCTYWDTLGHDAGADWLSAVAFRLSASASA